MKKKNTIWSPGAYLLLAAQKKKKATNTVKGLNGSRTPVITRFLVLSRLGDPLLMPGDTEVTVRSGVWGWSEGYSQGGSGNPPCGCWGREAQGTAEEFRVLRNHLCT